MNHIALRGASGEVRHAYYRAAEVTSWTVDGGLLEATIVHHDPFRCSQQPLVFEARHGKELWRWPVESLQVSGKTVTARLGPMEI